MSSSTNSPQRFSGTYDSFYSDASAAAAASAQENINSRMHVPKRIRVTGEHDDSPSVNWANYPTSFPDKLSMNVPERIMVAGGNHHIGSRGVPREFELEESLLPRPPDPTLYRVNTPPRTITLNSYTPDQEEDIPSSPQSSSSRNTSQPPSASGHPQHSTTSSSNHYTATTNQAAANYEEDSPVSGASQYQVTPSTVAGAGEELSPTEELQLLRRQVGRLNRRIMALELDQQQRSHREMILYTVGVAYCLLRSIVWLNKN